MVQSLALLLWVLHWVGFVLAVLGLISLLPFMREIIRWAVSAHKKEGHLMESPSSLVFPKEKGMQPFSTVTCLFT